MDYCSADTAAGRLKQHIALASLATAVGRIPVADTHTLLRMACEDLSTSLLKSSQSQAELEVVNAKLNDATVRVNSLEAVCPDSSTCRLTD